MQILSNVISVFVSTGPPFQNPKKLMQTSLSVQVNVICCLPPQGNKFNAKRNQFPLKYLYLLLLKNVLVKGLYSVGSFKNFAYEKRTFLTKRPFSLIFLFTSFQRHKWPQTKMHTNSNIIFGHSFSCSFT